MHAGTHRVAGIIGWPVAHSRSPRLHGYWLAEHRIAGSYVPLPVAPGRLPQALAGLAALGFAGANVTIPHKEEAAARADHRDASVARAGAANLLLVRDDGSLEARNTDMFGFLASLAEAAPDWRADAAPTVVLGAGGAARAIAAALLDQGAPSLRLLNRHRDRAEAVADALGGPIDVLDWSARHDALAGAGLLVNATSLGMTGQPELDIALDALPAAALVSDIVYAPMETPLLATARARGLAVAPGLPMLLHQARPAFAAWFGVMPDVTPALRRLMETP